MIKQPKKIGYVDIGIAVVCLVFLLYFALQIATAYTNTQNMVLENEKATVINTFPGKLQNQLSENTFDLSWNENTKSFLMWVCFAWLIGVAYYFSTRKKTIPGKEHGTAEWGTTNDIKDLFADNIAKEEIRKARQARFLITRWYARIRVYIKCEKVGSGIKERLMMKCKEKMIESKENGTFDKALYEKEKRDIEQKVKETVKLAKIEAWEPDKLARNYQETSKQIQTLYSQNLLDEQEKDKRLALAKTTYQEEVKKFYHGKGKKRAILKKYENADAPLTQKEQISIYNYVMNLHVAVFGGSGCGKTRSFVIPNLLQGHSSWVVTDPKGEVLEKVGYYLKTILGYDIRVLNLQIKASSDGYNPFVYVHPEREGYEERILTLIEAIILNTDGGERRNSSDPFWEKGERLFLQSIFFLTCDGYCLAERNMNTVLALIGMLKIAEEEDNFDSELDIFVDIFERIHGSDHIGVEQYREFRSKASGKTAKSIVVSAVARLAPFRTSAVKRLFSYDTMDLDMLGEKKMAVFVVVPPSDDTFNFIAGMLFTQMFQALEYSATEVYKDRGRKLPIPVRFILDEFATTCRIPNFVKILAYARSFGIGIVPVFQSLEQIKFMFKDEWGVVLDNCDTLLYLGKVKHMDTLEYLSKLLGKATFDKRTTGRSRGKQGSTSQNWDVIGCELMDAGQIRQLPTEDCLLIMSGRKPLYSKKFVYELHPCYPYTSDGNAAYSYKHTPLANPFLSSEDKDVPHGEDNIISSNVSVSVDEVTMDVNPQSVLGRVNGNYNYLVPVLDEDISVEDGEPQLTEDQAKDLLSLLSSDKDDEVADRILAVSAETEDCITEAKKDEIDMNLDVISVAQKVVRGMQYLVPVSDEDIHVEDGEPQLTDNQIKSLLSEFEGADFDNYDEDYNLREVLSDSEMLLGDVLNELIDSLPEERRETFNVETDKKGA